MKKLYIILLLSIVIPFLHGNQTIDVNVPYLMTFVNNSTYNLDTGAITSDTDFARTDKKINRNSILYVDDIDKITHVLFWDNLDQYIGYYNTPNTNITSTEFITSVSGNEFAPPANAYYFAFVINKTTFNNDTIIPALNNLTLNEVFVGGQLLLNNEFSSVVTPWSTLSYSNSINQGILELTSNAISTSARIDQSVSLNNAVYYINSRFKNIDTSYSIRFNSTVLIGSGLTNDNFISVSHITNWTSGSITNFRIYFPTTAIGQKVFVDYAHLINLTSLGIASLTQAQMDAYFNLWQADEFINGITFTTFQTAESYYRQTFYDPLPESSIALIVAGILGIGLMLLGFITNARIFNLFSIAPFTVFGLLLPNPAIIIAMVGLIIYQVYYAFWSKT